MTATKHSSAPWKVHEDLPCRIIKESHGRLRDYVEIGRAICEDVGDQTAMANAQLIAAAPEMYDALTALCKITGLGGNLNPNWDEVLSNAKAVLAKAKGETT